MNERKAEEIFTDLVCNQGGYPIYCQKVSVNPPLLRQSNRLSDLSGYLNGDDDVSLWGEVKGGLTYFPKALAAFFLVDLGLVFYGILRNIFYKWWVIGDRTLKLLWELLLMNQTTVASDLGIIILGESILIIIAFLWVVKK